MKAVFLLSSVALLALSACGKPAVEGNATGTAIATDEVAAKMDAMKLEAGEWEATQEILDVQLSGLPEGVPTDAANRMIGQRTSFKHCITPEQAARPSADFLSAQKDTNCTYANFDMSGGKVKADMSCAVPQQKDASMTIAMDGTYMPDRYDMDMNVKTAGLANGLTMTMKMKSSGKRIGECPAGADADAAGNSAG